MRLLVEKNFFIIETHVNVAYDSPCRGASTDFVERTKEHGPYNSRPEAQIKLSELKGGHQKEKAVHWVTYTGVSEKDPQNSITLFRKDNFRKDRPTNEIRPKIEERTVSQKEIK